MVAKGKRSQSTYSKYNTVYNRVLPLFSSQLKIEFIVEQGEDNMKQEIESNYCQIKSEILHIVENEMERIKNDPNLQHLIQQE